ncbi:MAG: glycosyltransferase family 2 protein [Chroococcus sp. CMT-3BRIN-NPC107]|jgi:glycosyltransferase involved in cell wall biosynthesis|nr:glycosyltransferase family 2 protein [Chroococcus sp. CMT-3BRIN-NPC107]
MTELTNPFVSVIIPVFNDSKRLEICLKILQEQTYPQSLYEIIVVDNGSKENIEAVVNQFSQATIAHESRQGSYAARNKGISLAKGEIIAFTDSDCVPATNWIENGVKSLQSVPNCGLAAGRIDLFFKDANNPTPVELYESIEMSFPQQRSLEKQNYGVTANLFTFKSVIDSVGLFDDTLKSCGDRQWGQRVFAAGYKQIYADDVFIAHPARDSFDELYKRVTRIVGGRYDLLKKNSKSSLEVIKDLLMAFKPPFRSFYRIWSNEKLQGNKQKLQFTFVMLFVRYVSTWERVRLQFGGEPKRG